MRDRWDRAWERIDDITLDAAQRFFIGVEVVATYVVDVATTPLIQPKHEESTLNDMLR